MLVASAGLSQIGEFSFIIGQAGVNWLRRSASSPETDQYDAVPSGLVQPAAVRSVLGSPAA
jgi:predicted Kef-type K+ transport protein